MIKEDVLKEVFKKYYTEAKGISVIETKYGYRIDVYVIGGEDFPAFSLPYETILFSKDFAEVFFGTTEWTYHSDNGLTIARWHCKEWEYRLQELSILDHNKRIVYLEKFLNV